MIHSVAYSILEYIGGMLVRETPQIATIKASNKDHNKTICSRPSTNNEPFIINNNSQNPDGIVVSSSNHHRFSQDLIKRFVRAGSGPKERCEHVIISGLDEGIPIDALDLICNGVTMNCLMMSSAWGEDKLTSLLLANGANADVQNSRGVTATHYSARNGCYNSLKRLIEHGANVFIRDSQGNRPLDEAKAMREEACVELLRRVESVVYAQAVMTSDAIHSYLDAETIENLYQFL